MRVVDNVAVGKRSYRKCLLFYSGCLPPAPQAPSGEKQGDMSTTADSRVGRAAPRADGAIKADAAAMTARRVRRYQFGGDRPSPADAIPVHTTATLQQGARAIGAQVHISTPRSAPWWVAGLATGVDTAASGDVPARPARWRERRTRTPHRSSRSPARWQSRSRGQCAVPASEYGWSSPDDHQHSSLPQTKEK